MANTQNASFQMLVLPDRHHFYTALAFHISLILDIRQNLSFSPPPFLFFSYLFIYLSLPFSSSYNPFLFPFPFLFLHFSLLRPSLFILSYYFISKGWRQVFHFFFFFFFLFKFIPHLYIFIRSGKLMFPRNKSFPPSLSLSFGKLLIVAQRHGV